MYRVAEDDGTVVVMVILSQPSTENIMVTINSSDITANGQFVLCMAAISCILTQLQLVKTMVRVE